MLRRSARLLSRELISSKSLGPSKTFSTAQLVVKHDCATKRFYVKLEKLEERAVICYDKIDAKTLDLYHTEVPASFQGLGVAKVLAKGAFEYCIENNYKMKLSCEYLQKYYCDNPLPQYKEIVVSA